MDYSPVYGGVYPYTLTLQDTLPCYANCYSIYLSKDGNYAAIGVRNIGLIIYDVSNPI
jgi:hypothetical protein